MLISQMVATDPKFLNTHVKDLTFSLFEVKVKIMNAVKFLVSPQLANFNSLGWINEGDVLGKKASPELFAVKREMYAKFGKLPYSAMFIENEEGGILVEKLSKKDYARYDTDLMKPGYINKFDTVITIIRRTGLVVPWRILLSLDGPDFREKVLDNDPFPTGLGAYGTEDEMQCAVDMTGALVMRYEIEKYYNYDTFMVKISSDAMLIMFEALMFMNAVNSNVIECKPRKDELKKIPKVLHPKFEYKILDIFRTKVKYDSLDDALTSISKVEENRNKRAHLVRGHFKTINGRLFWWNHFMRNRKNKEEVGYIKKDYYLAGAEQ